MARRKPTFVSLFSGCGGFDLGLKQAGFRCLHAFDFDRNAVEVHRQNLGSVAKMHDLSTGLPKGMESFAVDVMIAGPPCQGFSMAGKRDPDDPRNLLLTVPAILAKVLSPKVVLVENVTGVSTGEHKKHWEKLKRMLRSLDYHTDEIICNAVQYGVPQARRRIILVAWRSSHDITITIPFANGGVLADALRDLENVPNHSPQLIDPNSGESKIAQSIGPGQKLCNVRAGERSIHTWQIPSVFGRSTKHERAVLEAILKLRRQNRLRDFGDADPVALKDLSKIFGAKHVAMCDMV